MPSDRASKFPDKPWGTAITAIGLAKQDSSRYEGYTLVNIEPLKGSPDLYWIFEKLDGVVWETRGKARQSVVPEKFRDFTDTTRTTQDVDPDTLPSAIEGDLLSSVVEEQPNSGKAVKTEITESINEDASPLPGEIYGAVTTQETLESLVEDTQDADTGINVISSTVRPIGDGKAIKETRTAKGGFQDPSETGASKTTTAIPQKFGKFIKKEMSKKKVAAIPATISLTTDEISKDYRQETPDRFEETTVSETLSGETPLEGEEYGKIVSSETSEEVVHEGDAKDEGIEILSSRVTPIGNGKAIKTTEKVEGGVWPATVNESNSKTVPSVPAKFKDSVLTTTTTSKVASVPTSITLQPNEINQSYKKETADRAEKTSTTEVLTNAPPLAGETAYAERESASSSEEVVLDGAQADTGLHVVDSKVEPIGNGKSIKRTVEVDSWSELTASDWDAELGVQNTFTEEYVSPPNAAALLESDTSFRTINKDRSLKTVRVIPTTALAAYDVSFPVRINLNLPRVLKSVAVNWSSQFSVGTQEFQAYDFTSGDSGSVSISAPDSASSSASITANLEIVFEDLATTNLFADTRLFFMEGPVTQATILTRLGVIIGSPVTMWPVFKPQSSTITISGQSINVRANVNVSLNDTWSDSKSSSSWSKNESDDFAIGQTNDSVQIPPCIHAGVVITGDTSRSQPVSAVALTNAWSSRGTSVTASKTKSGTAFGVVSPSTIAATDGQNTIPTSGLYLVDMQISPTKYDNFFRVRAQVFDSSDLA